MQEKKGIIQVFRDAIWNPNYQSNEIVREEKRENFSFDTWSQLMDWVNSDQKDTDSGETINEGIAQRLDTVYSCINVLSQDVGTTECPLKKVVNGSKVIDSKNPLHYALNIRANRFQSAFQWKMLMVSHVQGWGNAYCGIINNEDGSTELIPLMPWETSPQIVDKELFFINKGIAHPSRDVLHFHMFSEDGVTGISPLSWNAKLMGYKIKQDRYSTRAIGVKPPGFVSGDATNEQFKANIASWNEHMKGDDPSGIPYMSGTNVKFNPLMIPPNEGQHLETKQYTDTKICAIYRVPKSKVQDTIGVKYSNQEQEDISYIKGGLKPIFTMMEQELDYKLLPESNRNSDQQSYFKFNLWDNVRADMKTRGEFYHTMRNDGIMNGDEIRGEIDLAPIPDELGKTHYIQGAMMPLQTQKDASLNKENNTEVDKDQPKKEEDGREKKPA